MGRPRRLGDKESQYTDIACDESSVAAVWDAFTSTGTAIFASISEDAGQTWPEIERLTPDGTTATHPRLVKTSTGYRAFWTQRRGTEALTWTSKGINRR